MHVVYIGAHTTDIDREICNFTYFMVYMRAAAVSYRGFSLCRARVYKTKRLIKKIFLHC